jgi:hypothetical protein
VVAHHRLAATVLVDNVLRDANMRISCREMCQVTLRADAVQVDFCDESQLWHALLIRREALNDVWRAVALRGGALKEVALSKTVAFILFSQPLPNYVDAFFLGDFDADFGMPELNARAMRDEVRFQLAWWQYEVEEDGKDTFISNGHCSDSEEEERIYEACISDDEEVVEEDTEQKLFSNHYGFCSDSEEQERRFVLCRSDSEEEEDQDSEDKVYMPLEYFESRYPLGIFGLVMPFTEEDLKRKLKELRRHYHPDKAPNCKDATAIMALINSAANELRDKNARFSPQKRVRRLEPPKEPAVLENGDSVFPIGWPVQFTLVNFMSDVTRTEFGFTVGRCELGLYTVRVGLNEYENYVQVAKGATRRDFEIVGKLDFYNKCKMKKFCCRDQFVISNKDERDRRVVLGLLAEATPNADLIYWSARFDNGEIELIGSMDYSTCKGSLAKKGDLVVVNQRRIGDVIEEAEIDDRTLKYKIKFRDSHEEAWVPICDVRFGLDSEIVKAKNWLTSDDVKKWLKSQTRVVQEAFFNIFYRKETVELIDLITSRVSMDGTIVVNVGNALKACRESYHVCKNSIAQVLESVCLYYDNVAKVEGSKFGMNALLAYYVWLEVGGDETKFKKRWTPELEGRTGWIASTAWNGRKIGEFVNQVESLAWLQEGDWRIRESTRGKKRVSGKTKGTKRERPSPLTHIRKGLLCVLIEVFGFDGLCMPSFNVLDVAHIENVESESDERDLKRLSVDESTMYSPELVAGLSPPEVDRVPEMDELM